MTKLAMSSTTCLRVEHNGVCWAAVFSQHLREFSLDAGSLRLRIDNLAKYGINTDVERAALAKLISKDTLG